jgi:hypothetical protein
MFGLPQVSTGARLIGGIGLPRAHARPFKGGSQATRLVTLHPKQGPRLSNE